MLNNNFLSNYSLIFQLMQEYVFILWFFFFRENGASVSGSPAGCSSCGCYCQGEERGRGHCDWDWSGNYLLLVSSSSGLLLILEPPTCSRLLFIFQPATLVEYGNYVVGVKVWSKGVLGGPYSKFLIHRSPLFIILVNDTDHIPYLCWNIWIIIWDLYCLVLVSFKNIILRLKLPLLSLRGPYPVSKMYNYSYAWFWEKKLIWLRKRYQDVYNNLLLLIYSLFIHI